VHKRVLNLAGTVICLRTSGKHERKAISEWATSNLDPKELDLIGHLPTLKTGQAHIWSPSFLGISKTVTILKKRTLDSSATPEVGSEEVTAKVIAPLNLDELRAAMASVVAEAEKNDPRALQREIARLKGELVKKPDGVQQPAAQVKREAVPVISGKERAAIERLSRDLETFYDRLSPLRVTAEDLKGRLSELMKKYPAEVGAAPTVRPTTVRNLAPPPPRPAHERTLLKAEGLSAKATEILRELVALPELANSRDNLAMRAGLRNNGNFRNYMSELRTTCTRCGLKGSECTCASGPAGLLEKERDVPTEAGMKLVAGTRAKTFDELRAQWGGLLSAKAAAMFDAAIATGDKPLSRDDLAAAVELQNNGNFRNYMSELNTAALLDDEKRHRGIVANPALYLGGA
jgi:uncharacterized small protein (DUF1192 family)